MRKLSKLDAIDAVASRLSGSPWNSETCGDIAEILRRAGYTIRDVETERVERELFEPQARGPIVSAQNERALERGQEVCDRVLGATRRDHQELGVPSANPDYPEDAL